MDLLKRAKSILQKNDMGKFTVPSLKQYPHQWSWDSGFIAIGYSHYDTKRAIDELESLFEGQWENGMLPHIIFRSDSDYFPGPDYWDINLSKNSSKLQTSGITQPPLPAIAALKIYQNAKDKQLAKKFLKTIYPKIIRFHEFLVKFRDPEKSGKLTIFHPWESGFDNSSRWDWSLQKIIVKDLPNYVRQDRAHVNFEERPSNDDYDKYIYLIEIMKQNKYDQDEIYKKIPFKIKDIVFTTIFHKANKCLIDIEKILEIEKSNVRQWIHTTKNAFNKLGCKQAECLFYDYDLENKEIIRRRTIAAILPVFAQLPSRDNLITLKKWMLHANFCSTGDCNNHTLPSVPLNASSFNPLNYWRGPIWININWMLFQGFLDYGEIDKAKHIKKDILHLVKTKGFFEYFDPLTGDGKGIENFSWTASLIIDLLEGE